MVKENKQQDGLHLSALDYHERVRPGKIEVVSTKPCVTQRDLSLAYTPGVAAPCLEIHRDPALARKYTSKGNLVAVVTNGTAVLGLGNIGPLAGKPVMEGKGVLFKRFAGIDVFDIELNTENPDEVIRTVQLLEPTFGGINLEDIKAPECFYIEETLKKTMNIPVFHDDQHGTAIISGAALLNALEITGKKAADVRVVFSGAGAAAIACANFYISLGVDPGKILMTDSRGVLWQGRGDEESNPYKKPFFRDTDARDLADAVRGSDVFCGLSSKGVLSPDMVRTMADQPIIFAMANPDPEISYPDAKTARPDAIVATGRSDYPNQVNNVLGFPFIFRGALDVEATAINEEMKLAVAHALARLAKEEVPETVKRAYNDPSLSFGPEYIIPKPFDSRVLLWASPAVAEAAMKTGVARRLIDMEAYREQLRERIDWSREVMRKVHIMARNNPKRVVFPEGDHPKIIWAASEMVRERLAHPILLAKNKTDLLNRFEELNHSPAGIEIIEPKNYTHREAYVTAYYQMLQRKGVTQKLADQAIRNYFNFGMMMLKIGQADGLLGGVSVNYPEVLQPAIQIIGPRQGGRLVAGLYLIQDESRSYYFADCTVNVNPNAADLAEITLMAAAELERFEVIPRIAMLSFSNFCSIQSPETEKVAEAVEILHRIRPDLMVDGPIQADAALDLQFIQEFFPFSQLKQRPNLLIFPNLDAGNISLKLLRRFGNHHDIGPMIIGLAKPVHILTRVMEVNNIINLAAVASLDAQQVS